MSFRLVSSESDAVENSNKIKLEPSTERNSSPRSSPLSSPPVVNSDASQEMPSATRKRSHEDMSTESADVNDSSATAVGDVDAQTKQDMSSNVASGTVKPSTSAHTVLPPSAHTSSVLPPSQKTPRSGQGSAQSQDPQPLPSTVANAKGRKGSRDSGSNDSMNEEPESPDSLAMSDPQEKIEDFDWNDLQQRYHDKIAQLDATEQSILAEFGSLCDVSAVRPRL